MSDIKWMAINYIIELIWSKEEECEAVSKKLQKCNCYDTITLYLSLENINDNLTLMKLKNFKNSTLEMIKDKIEENTNLDILKLLKFIKINWTSQKEKVKVLTKLQNIEIQSFSSLLDNVDCINNTLTLKNEKTFGEATIENIKSF